MKRNPFGYSRQEIEEIEKEVLKEEKEDK